MMKAEARFEAGEARPSGMARVFVRYLRPAPGETSPGTWLAALSSRALALLCTLETASLSARPCGRIRWSQFHHLVLGGAALRLVESELNLAKVVGVPISEKATDTRPARRLAVRRHRELLRLVRTQLQEAFGTGEHTHPACLAHRTLAELEPVMGCSFSEDLLGGSIQRELRRELSLRPGLLPATWILLDTCTATVAGYWRGLPARPEPGILPPPRLAPDLPGDLPDVHC